LTAATNKTPVTIAPQFWSIKLDGETQKTVKEIKINQLLLNRYLSNQGFRRFAIEQNYFFVFVKDNICTLVTEVDIKDHVFSQIRQLPDLIDEAQICHRDLLENKLLTGISSYFNKEKLYQLKPLPADNFNLDTHGTKFIYYANCYVSISIAGVEIKQYNDLEKCIWKDEILQRDFRPGHYDENNDTAQFFKLITGRRGLLDQTIFTPMPARFDALQKITGYLLHNYFEYKLKAILLTDSTITEENEANGRTGKTLFCKMIAHTLSNNPNEPTAKTFVELNGKDFDPLNDKKYQTLSIETKLIHINDVKRYFDADSLYNDITDGISVNRKFRDPFKLLVKLVLSTNKTIKLDGESSKDRFIEFQFGDWFSSLHSPEKQFNKWLFRDWSTEDWRQYDLFMQKCCLAWISDPALKEPTQINLAERKLIDSTSPDFIEFMTPTPGNDFNPSGGEFSTSELFDNFCAQYPDWSELVKRGKFNNQRFKKWLINWCNFSPGYVPYKKATHSFRKDNKHFIKFLIEQ
jgi:hypothetical protein